MAKKTYLQENYEYSQRMWSQWMAAQVSRRFVVKAGSLAALGGTSALSQLMVSPALSFALTMPKAPWRPSPLPLL